MVLSSVSLQSAKIFFICNYKLWINLGNLGTFSYEISTVQLEEMHTVEVENSLKEKNRIEAKPKVNNSEIT